MSERYKLPVSSYEEVIKIIKAYASGKEGVPVSLEDLVKASGIGRTTLSKNNGFLVVTGLVSEGNKKAPTSLCMQLARAYSMTVVDEIRKIWTYIVREDEFLSKLSVVVNVKGSISRTDFLNHILFSAECNNSAAYRAGASTIIEILKMFASQVQISQYTYRPFLFEKKI